MTIAVTTPTGNVGSELVRRLIQAGERPVVLVRDPARLDPEVGDLVDARAGDLADLAYLIAALQGVEALYLVVPEVPTAADPEADAEAIADAVIAAADAAGVARVVFQSSGGADQRSGAGFISALGRIEARLDEFAQRTGASVAHLRCGYLFTNLLMDVDGLREGRLTMPLPGDLPMPWVAPVDIAAVAAGRLLSGAWSGRVVQPVNGPEDLTYDRVADIIREATGWPVEYIRSSDDEAREGLRAAGFSDAGVESVVGMSVGTRDTVGAAADRTVHSTTPTPLAGWVSANLG